MQECHDVCVTKLKEACKEAVTLFLKDPSHPFPQEVKFCMNDAFSIELRSAPDKSVHEVSYKFSLDVMEDHGYSFLRL